MISFGKINRWVHLCTLIPSTSHIHSTRRRASQYDALFIDDFSMFIDEYFLCKLWTHQENIISIICRTLPLSIVLCRMLAIFSSSLIDCHDIWCDATHCINTMGRRCWFADHDYFEWDCDTFRMSMRVRNVCFSSQFSSHLIERPIRVNWLTRQGVRIRFAYVVQCTSNFEMVIFWT